MEIELRLPKADFIPKEEITVRASLRNNGPAPLTVAHPFDNRNWQPVFQVKGPSYPHSFAFTLRTMATEDKRLEPQGLAPVMVTIKPGETISSELPFHTYLNLSQPGEYEVVARYLWGQTEAKSDPLRFRIQPASVVAAALAADIGAAAGAPYRALVLQNGGGAKRLYEEFFVEERPDLGEVQTDSLVPQGEVGAAAARVFSPWSNFNRNELPFNWQVWTDSGRLFAKALIAPEPSIYDLGEATVLRPPLMGPGGHLEVFALADGGRELRWVHFPSPDMRGGAGPPRMEWALPVTPAAQTGRCTLAPRAAGGGWHVILASQAGDSVTLQYINASMVPGDGGPLTIQIQQAHLVPGSEPAIQAIDTGDIEIAVLVQRDRTLRDLAIARFKIDGTLRKAGEVQVTEVGQLPGAVRAGAAVFSVDPKRARQLSWLVLMRDGRVLSSSTPTKPYALDSRVVLPLELLPVSAYTYLLTIARDGLPALIPVR